jgi:prepilin-type N-terminal cleavage/methylation domain-containing protein
MKTKSNKKLNKSPFLKGDVRRTGGLAFTLFELLVSISIIGILIAVASMSYGGAQKKARDTRRIEDLNTIQKAMEMYYSQSGGSYPGAGVSSALVPTYLPSWPNNPKGNPYSYSYSTPNNSYCFGVLLDNPTGGNCSNTTCNFVANSTHYCVKNQQ